MLKLKKNKKRKIKWYLILFLIMAFLTYQITYSILLKNILATSNEEFLMYLLYDSNYHVLYEKNNHTVINKISSLLGGFNISKPISILESSFGYKNKNQKLAYNDSYDPKKLEGVTKYIKDPNPTIVNDPLVYIYNTHQLENYSNETLEAYNITPNVMMASYLLKENLNKQKIKTIVEESNITEFLRMNNWDYSQSYKASRFYILDAINKYPTTKLFIDIHRDSVKKATSTVDINNKKYASVLFVVGLDYENYQNNLKLANDMNALINKSYPNLSRGVIKKGGKGVDGIYNQDLHDGIMLIEVGGSENNISEVMNTMNALANVISSYLGDL